MEDTKVVLIEHGTITHRNLTITCPDCKQPTFIEVNYPKGAPPQRGIRDCFYCHAKLEWEEIQSES